MKSLTNANIFRIEYLIWYILYIYTHTYICLNKKYINYLIIILYEINYYNKNIIIVINV